MATSPTQDLRDRNLGTTSFTVTHDVPSSKYVELPNPPRTMLEQAAVQPKPLLPKFKPLRTWRATNRETVPLNASLIGAARACKQGELVGEGGSRYTGEALAGRPHGQGCLSVPKHPGSSELVLHYEGSWVEGQRHGQGTQYYRSGEHYSGNWVRGRRQGQGRQQFLNGDLYTGAWQQDQRHGHGVLYLANGDIFAGTFCSDKQHGLGCLYLVASGRKMVGEWVKGHVASTSLYHIDDPEGAVVDDLVHQEACSKCLELKLAGTAKANQLPSLQLAQPHGVLVPEVVASRQQVAQADQQERQMVGSGRQISILAPRSLVLHDGTLDGHRLVALQFAFNHLAGGSDAPALPAEKIWQMCVRARLDPGVAVVQQLAAALQAAVEARGQALGREAFLRTLLHFRASK